MMWGYKNHRKILRSELRASVADSTRQLAMYEANLVRAKLEQDGCEAQITFQRVRQFAAQAALDAMDRADELEASKAPAKADARKRNADHGRSDGNPQDGDSAERAGGQALRANQHTLAGAGGT